jgi:hypothetical protein
MGPYATEADFDSFASYVAANIGIECGGNVDVEQFPFANGPANDAISNANGEYVAVFIDSSIGRQVSHSTTCGTVWTVGSGAAFSES